MKKYLIIVAKAAIAFVAIQILLTVFAFLLHYLPEIIIGKSYSIIDFKDCLYEFKRDGIIQIIQVVAVYSVGMYFLGQILLKVSNGKITTTLSFLFGNVIIIVCSFLISFWIQNSFAESSFLIKDAYIKSFGKISNIGIIMSIIVCILFSIWFLSERLDIFFLKNAAKQSWKQTMENHDYYSPWMYSVIPIVLFLTGNYLCVITMRIPVLMVFVLCTIISWMALYIKHLIDYRILNKYYQMILCDEEKRHNSILIESDKSFLSTDPANQIINKQTPRKQLEAKRIFLLPIELVDNKELHDFIKLDIYNDGMLLQKESKKDKIIKEMQESYGLFNIAYQQDSDVCNELSSRYTACYSSVPELIQGIVKYNGYLQYYRELQKILSTIKFEQFSYTNVIIEEIAELKSYLEKNVNEFLVFDISIKWLEIVNYLFSLVLLLENHTSVKSLNVGSIKNATFDTWRRIREKRLFFDERFTGFANESVIDKKAFDSFSFIWKAVTSREYRFNVYSVEELFQGAKELRNYTRGHGVFSFEISKEINLHLVTVVAFLVNQLIESGQLDQSFEAMETLGWIVYLGDTPYYLYSYNEKYNEYDYLSFRSGKLLSLPIDVYGEKE